MINSVKICGNGYFVNGDTITAETEEIKQWLLDGGIPEPEFTETELAVKTAQEAKQAKQIALSTLTVTTSNGNTFDGNESARINMVSAIAVADIAGITEKQWKLADNTVKLITLAELKEALLLAILAVGEIIL